MRGKELPKRKGQFTGRGGVEGEASETFRKKITNLK